ncbi:pyrokinin-1 receptor-like [Cylas formicarius]|uniref:pyrokinin-1 receptor-like n=1 Tax=Cylas formicarius TaxID=197179 RepID=UPI00295868BD|nr:pyrokinin-1 receptor-like [Cylas formicarius]
MDFANDSFCDVNLYGPKRDGLSVVVPVTVIYVVIFITGTVGNVTTCIVIARNKSLHTATNYYLFSLALSDLVLLVSGLPQEIYLIWNRYPYIFGGTFCFLRGLLAETSGNATVLTITGFTVERYLAICHPFLSQTMSKLSRAIKFILFIWLVAISFAIPQALALKVDGTCPHCLPTRPVMDHSFEISTFVFFVTPMTLITVLYVLIGSTLRSSRMMKMRNVGAKDICKSSRRVVKMLVAVVVTFFICWAPFHVQRLYTIYATFPKADEQTHSLYLQVYSVVTYVSGILYYVSATSNPILYSIMSMKFRKAFKETFARCCGIKLKQGQQRQYSALSKCNPKAVDSVDSTKENPTIHTNTSLTRKTSSESFLLNGKRPKMATRKATTANGKSNGYGDRSVRVETRQTIESQNRLAKFSRYFGCLKKHQDAHNENIELKTRDGKKNCCGSDIISNSSLEDVEKGAIEDELTVYMKNANVSEC